MLRGMLAVVVLVALACVAGGCIGGPELEEDGAGLARQGATGDTCFIYDPVNNIYVMGTMNENGGCQIGCMSCPTWGTTQDCLIDPFCEEPDTAVLDDPPPTRRRQVAAPSGGQKAQ